MMQQQAAEIAFFKLKGARSYRFVNLPTVRKLDVQAGQILRVTDSRDISYFRQRPDVMMECDESGKGLNEPEPGTITAPNALTKRKWRSPSAPAVSSVAGQQQVVPGTMVVGSQLPPAQNPTGQHGVSAYNQHPPGLVNKGQQPTVVQSQVARPTVTTGVLGIHGRGAQQPPAAVAPAQTQTSLPEVRLGQVMTGGRAVPGSAPSIQPAPQTAPVAPVPSTAPRVVAPVRSPAPSSIQTSPAVAQDPIVQQAVAEAQQAGQIDPIVQQALAMHPGARTAGSAPSDGQFTIGGAQEVAEKEAVVVDPPQDVPQSHLGPDGSIDPAYLASPIPEGGLPTPPQAVATHPSGAAPSVVGVPSIAAPNVERGSGVLASASARALAQGRGVPDASHAQQILAEMGQSPDPVPESPVERIGADGRPAGSY